MAVSSLVSCSLSSSITRASPCMGSLLGPGCAEAIGPGLSSGDRADLQAVQRVRRAQPVADPVQAVAAPGAGGAGVADLLLGARTGGDDVCQRCLADGEADAGVHANSGRRGS